MKWILSNPVLFRAWGSDWQLSKLFLYSGLFFMFLAGLLFLALVRHTKTKGRRLSADGASDVALNAGKPMMRNMQGIGKSVGAGIEIHAGIDDFRQAARRGDWTFFFLFPAVVSFWCGGMWLLLSAFCMAMPLGVWLLVSVVCAGMVGLVLFMPWAALYTNIDAPRPDKQPPRP